MFVSIDDSLWRTLAYLVLFKRFRGWNSLRINYHFLSQKNRSLNIFMAAFTRHNCNRFPSATEFLISRNCWKFETFLSCITKTRPITNWFPIALSTASSHFQIGVKSIKFLIAFSWKIGVENHYGWGNVSKNEISKRGQTRNNGFPDQCHRRVANLTEGSRL